MVELRTEQDANMSSPPSLAHTLSHWAMDLRFDQAPSEVQRALRCCLLYNLSMALAVDQAADALGQTLSSIAGADGPARLFAARGRRRLHQRRPGHRARAERHPSGGGDPHRLHRHPCGARARRNGRGTRPACARRFAGGLRIHSTNRTKPGGRHHAARISRIVALRIAGGGAGLLGGAGPERAAGAQRAVDRDQPRIRAVADLD